jgi:hypothetical protein
MDPTASSQHDDRVTVCATAVIAACVVTIAHEAAGHGSACLAAGGRIVRLTSVYFSCSVHSAWVAPAGPAGNLAAAAAARALLIVLPAGRPRARLLLLLVMAFSLFWAAGYLLYSMTLGVGDYAIAERDAFGKGGWPAMLIGWSLGLLLYLVAIRATTRAAQPFARPSTPASTSRARSLLGLSWLAASLAACVAAAFYAPGRLDAVRQAALELGAASLPLLFVAPRARAGTQLEPPATRSGLWISLAVLLFLGFVLTLGRGVDAGPG